MIRYDGGLFFLGHPLHPALVHFPLGLLPASLVADLVGVLGVTGPWWTLGYWMLAAGLVAGVVAAGVGVVDLFALEPQHPALDVAVRHLIATGGALLLFLVSLLLRGGAGTPASGRVPWILVLSTSGVVALSVGGWLGGELVYRHGIGQRPGRTSSPDTTR